MMKQSGINPYFKIANQNLKSLVSDQAFKHIFSNVPDMFDHELAGGLAITAGDRFDNLLVFQGAVDKILIGNVSVSADIIDAVAG